MVPWSAIFSTPDPTYGTDKVYIALFSCCVSRALHLDLVRDLSTQEYLRCLRRFSAHRGTPALIVSDNTKTFKASAKALKKLYNCETLQGYLGAKRIEWKFNLERAPRWGGFFKRMVQSVKRCLRKVLGNARLTFDNSEDLIFCCYFSTTVGSHLKFKGGKLVLFSAILICRNT